MIKIGLEIHCYIKLEKNKTKLFCNCPVNYTDNEPNTNICPRCTGMPGAKPMLPNSEAMEKVLKLAIMLNCKIPDKWMLFQRKHYDWPDMPVGFQKTMSGPYSVNVGVKGEFNDVGIWEIHIEEDPARWDPDSGCVDYNRAGMPLIEIVTAPDIKSAEQARQWLKQLITLMNYVKVMDNEMGIKADVNVNVKSHPRVEVKNVNSFKNICKAIEYEIERQNKLKGKKVCQEETRAFVDSKGITVHMRYKESAADYMFIPEPDLPSIKFEEKYLEKLRKELPESPKEKYEKFVKRYRIDKKDAETISKDLAIAELFEKVSKKVDPVLAGRWIRRDLNSTLTYNKISLEESGINEQHMVDLLEEVEKKKITDLVAKEILYKLAKGVFDVKTYIKENNLETVSNEKELEKLCDEIIKENPQAVKDYKQGEEKAFNFLIGRVSAKTKGKADPIIVKKLLLEKIG
jgi:aspartyl-tRNA(Asn)/glutamyl-tRNA(Gln) amidotransferase subunit B